MFTELAKILGTTTLNLSISYDKENDKMTVIALPKSDKKELQKLSPIVLSGTPAEIETALVPTIQIPVVAINEFTVKGKDEIMADIETAKETVTKKEKTKTEKPAKEAIQKKDYKQIFAEANKLFTEKKYTEAKPLYEECVAANPTNKQYKMANESNERWLKAMADMYPSETKTATLPLLVNDEIKVFDEEVTEEEFSAMEGPEESEDNTKDNTEEDFNLLN